LLASFEEDERLKVEDANRGKEENQEEKDVDAEDGARAGNT